MKHGQKNYSSKDFYLSSCLIAAGLNLSNITQSNNGYFLFHFDSSEKEALDILDRHWSGSLEIPTKDFVEAIYQLKNRMRVSLKSHEA
ncbi:MAG: hypothetical protein H6774_03050 [Pseudomonadales bacterium]|nr:hypothetical protein [Pseudomonadales bacterium]